MAEKLPKQSVAVPAYNYDLSPTNPQNRAAAKARGWRFDRDWHDHVDEKNFRVRGPWHRREECETRR